MNSIDTDWPLDTAAGYRELEHKEANFVNEQVKASIGRVQNDHCPFGLKNEKAAENG
ncbi:hypothetical protein D3C81_2044360 [compost metagenome]